jgi:hypothetical protein
MARRPTLPTSARTLIAVLFALCRPSTIPWRIRAVVVDTVDRVLTAWSWSHIAHKFREVARPFRAHVNAASAVVCEVTTVGVGASAFGLTPCVPFRGDFSDTSESVLKIRAAILFGATATRRVARHEVGSCRAGRYAAIAQACPSRLSSNIGLPANGSQRSETLSRQVTRSHKPLFYACPVFSGRL